MSNSAFRLHEGLDGVFKYQLSVQILAICSDVSKPHPDPRAYLFSRNELSSKKFTTLESITYLVHRPFRCNQLSKSTDPVNTSRCFDKMENMSLKQEKQEIAYQHRP